MASFKLPTLRNLTAIVTGAGLPTDFFVRLWNNDLVPRIELAVTDLQAVQAQIQAVQVQQAQQLEQIQQALELAGTALEAADGGTGNKSGSATGSFALTSTSFGAPVATVMLTGVVAGDLTIPGTGPSQQIGTTMMTGGTFTSAEYQIVEVDNGVDNGVVFTGQFTATDITTDEPNQIFTINHTSADAVAAFLSARTTTGNIDYRVETRKVSGANMSGMRFYLFARRAA